MVRTRKPKRKVTDKPMTVSFYNVTIHLHAESPEKAYDELCELLQSYDNTHGGGSIDWETDTYAIDDGDPRDTIELFPRDGDPRETARSRKGG